MEESERMLEATNEESETISTMIGGPKHYHQQINNMNGHSPEFKASAMTPLNSNCLTAETTTSSSFIPLIATATTTTTATATATTATTPLPQKTPHSQSKNRSVATLYKTDSNLTAGSASFHVYDPELLNKAITDFSTSSSASISSGISSCTTHSDHQVFLVKNQTIASNHGDINHKNNTNKNSIEDNGLDNNHDLFSIHHNDHIFDIPTEIQLSAKKHQDPNSVDSNSHYSSQSHPNGIPLELEFSRMTKISQLMVTTPKPTESSSSSPRRYHQNDPLVESLAKRGNLLASIQNYAGHVPMAVLNGLEREVQDMTKQLLVMQSNHNHHNDGLGDPQNPSIHATSAEIMTPTTSNPDMYIQDDVSELSDAEDLFFQDQDSQYSDIINGDNGAMHSETTNNTATNRPLHHNGSDSELSYDLFAEIASQNSSVSQHHHPHRRKSRHHHSMHSHTHHVGGAEVSSMHSQSFLRGSNSSLGDFGLLSNSSHNGSSQRQRQHRRSSTGAVVPNSSGNDSVARRNSAGSSVSRNILRRHSLQSGTGSHGGHDHNSVTRMSRRNSPSDGESKNGQFPILLRRNSPSDTSAASRRGRSGKPPRESSMALNHNGYGARKGRRDSLSNGERLNLSSAVLGETNNHHQSSNGVSNGHNYNSNGSSNTTSRDGYPFRRRRDSGALWETRGGDNGYGNARTTSTTTMTSSTTSSARRVSETIMPRSSFHGTSRIKLISSLEKLKEVKSQCSSSGLSAEWSSRGDYSSRDRSSSTFQGNGSNKNNNGKTKKKKPRDGPPPRRMIKFDSSVRLKSFHDSMSTHSSRTMSVATEDLTTLEATDSTKSYVMPQLTLNQMTTHDERTTDDDDMEQSKADDDISIDRKLARRALFGGKLKSLYRPAEFKDPFPFDSDDELQLVNRKSKSGVNATLKRPSRPTLAHQRSSTRGGSTKCLRASRPRTIGNTEENILLPHSSAHQSALLFVDISGFTKLATTLDPESLSKAINSYFQLIVNEVTSFGGDVLKFAGDAVFCEWKASSRDMTNAHLVETRRLTLVECVSVAASCAVQIVAQCSDFPIHTSSNQVVATLNVHCGIGVGEIIGVHVGDYEIRREYLILGDPIDQVAAACSVATLGEVAASPQALMTLSKCCDFDDEIRQQPAGRPVVIAQRSVVKFRSKTKTNLATKTSSSALTIAQRVENWHIDMLSQYKKLMSLYVHPVVVDNDSSLLNQGVNPKTLERHREEAEIRNVYTMFITPLISVRVTGSPEADRQLYKLLNNIMNLCTRELTRFSGHLRQFIVDDKGLVLIATFGLRGSTFPNMVGERALPASITIHNALRHELGVQNQVGGTIGNAYCGVVGGIKRNEYAVLGPSVNLAARLMSSPKNPGILVDNAVRMMADKSYGFNALAPVKAKGYTEPVPIFEPLSPLERSWGRVQPNFVGRRREIMTLMSTAREMALTQCNSKMVLFSGVSGMGKSTIVVHAIEHIRKLMGGSRRRLIVTKHVSKESELLVPFGMFRSILVDVLSYFRGAQDDKSMISFTSAGGMESIGWESLSGGSVSNSTATGLTRSRDRLSSICRELNAPPVFQQLVGHHLLGIEANKGRDQKGNRGNRSSMKQLVTFMARAFKRCTQEASLVIIALDDVHYMDEMSWKVVQELFETGSSILFLCTSRPTSTYRLSVDKAFWEKLKTDHKADGGFELIELDRLSDKEIKQMIAKTLGLQVKEVSSTLFNDVVQQSNGMPHFANEILETIKRGNAEDRERGTGDEKRSAENAFVSVGELLLHRIDSFEATVRNILILGAVLGTSFRLAEIMAVLHKTNPEDACTKTQQEHAMKALDTAVSEGILYLVHEREEANDESEELVYSESAILQESQHSFGSSTRNSTRDGSISNIEYTFCHTMWRSTILKLMLDARKKDLHRIIAETLEEQQGTITEDYLSRMKLFSHWKASGNTSKAASLALRIGKSFEELGLLDQSINLYHDTLDMWKHTDGPNANKSPGESSVHLVDSLSNDDLAYVIKVYIAMGQCFANAHKAVESVAAYQNALKALSTAPGAEEIRDRSIIFPIFSGLFSAIKFGQIKQDEDCSYERSLVTRFVAESKLHGDPVHYSRALAMQADTSCRLGHYDEALQTQMELQKVYDVHLHSRPICDIYGSDRAGQSFSMSALWYVTQGKISKAVDVCWHVINTLLPAMDIRNVHNSCIVLYPVLWVLKDNGYADKARDAFVRFVVEPFNEYFEDGRSTFCLPIYDPVLCVLELSTATDTATEDFDEYLDWALTEENLRFGTVLNNALGGFGRCPDCMAAEICMLLAEHMENDNPEKRFLIIIGLELANEVMSLVEIQRMWLARAQCEPIQKRLRKMVKQLPSETPFLFANF